MAGLASSNVLLHRLRIQGQKRSHLLVELRQVIVPRVLHLAVFKNELAQGFNEFLTRTNRRRWIRLDNPLYPIQVLLEDCGISDCGMVLQEMDRCRPMESRKGSPCVKWSAADVLTPTENRAISAN
jgi:hypothetical protein